MKKFKEIREKVGESRPWNKGWKPDEFKQLQKDKVLKKELEKYLKVTDDGMKDFTVKQAQKAFPYLLKHINTNFGNNKGGDVNDTQFQNVISMHYKRIMRESVNVDEGLGNSTPNVKKKTGIGTDGTVFNIPGKKPGSVFHVKPRLDGNTLKFGTVNNFGDIKVMTIKELEKVLR